MSNPRSNMALNPQYNPFIPLKQGAKQLGASTSFKYQEASLDRAQN